MDDLNDKITRLLSSPDGMAKIQAAMASLSGLTEAAPPAGADTPADTPAPPPPPPAVSTGGEPAGGGLPDLTLLAKLAPMLGTLGQDDDDARLLQALRPYLHGEREQRLDEAMRLLRLSRLLPLLREQPGAGGSQR